MSNEETWRAVDVSGPANVAYQIWSGSRMVAIAFSRADADAIIRDHQQAQQVAALKAMLERFVAKHDAMPAFLDELKLLPRKQQDARVKSHNKQNEVEIEAARKALAAISGKET